MKKEVYFTVNWLEMWLLLQTNFRFIFIILDVLCACEPSEISLTFDCECVCVCVAQQSEKNTHTFDYPILNDNLLSFFPFSYDNVFCFSLTVFLCDCCCAGMIEMKNVRREGFCWILLWFGFSFEFSNWIILFGVMRLRSSKRELTSSYTMEAYKREKLMMHFISFEIWYHVRCNRFKKWLLLIFCVWFSNY